MLTRITDMYPLKTLFGRDLCFYCEVGEMASYGVYWQIINTYYLFS